MVGRTPGRGPEGIATGRAPGRRESPFAPALLAGMLGLVLGGGTIPSLLAGPPHTARDRFEQLGTDLPTPGVTRTASGDAGHAYWQQKVDYDIDVTLDEAADRVTGRERIVYHNHSPDRLAYIWVQLEQNIFRPDSGSNLTDTTDRPTRLTFSELKSTLARETFDGGYGITSVKDAEGRDLPHVVNDTMMRIDLPTPLAPGATTVFEIGWTYHVNDADVIWARTGYEILEADRLKIFEMAHWYPRVAAYTDYTGWQHKQFLGKGEFTLEFGDYTVDITVPADHVVAATGELQNPAQVLTDAQRARLDQARTAEKPVMIVTTEEAAAARKAAVGTKEKPPAPVGTKTWRYAARNVRDFAWASSRTFLWDAQGHTVPADGPADTDQFVLAMSYYPAEGDPLWSRYSTASIIHTLNVYSRYTFKYPYPIAISVNGPIGGMEYPMICFNGPRPEKDGTYSANTKYGLISVIIHEVGHNYFPMIVNSDERQWTWMDEGLNTFCQFLAEQEWEKDYPSWRGEPKNIVGYMTSTNQVPIMSNSESLLQFGNNAYAKPATALNILRETVLGRELFDHAFKTYARRWQFKRPEPADFFRTMEDASGTDLDWFWRGWFYTTDHVDLALTGIELFTVDTGDPEIASALKKTERDAEPKTRTRAANETMPRVVDAKPELKDFYNAYDDLEVRPAAKEKYQKFVAGLTDDEKALLREGRNFYLVTVSNVGGLVMPVILGLEYEDGTKEEKRLPAEIWRFNDRAVSKLLISEKTLKSVTLDPHLETADADTSNNAYPPTIAKSRFQLYREAKEKNPMQRLRAEEEAAKKAAEKKAGTKPDAEKPAGEAKPPETMAEPTEPAGPPAPPVDAPPAPNPGGPGDTKAKEEPAGKGAAEVRIDPEKAAARPTDPMPAPADAAPAAEPRKP